MSDTNDCAETDVPQATVIVERTYRAGIEDVWALWTTKEGFESWWGPVGFRVDVHEWDGREGGVIVYDMVAHAPEVIAAMTRMGQPLSHATRGRFTVFYQRALITTDRPIRVARWT